MISPGSSAVSNMPLKKSSAAIFALVGDDRGAERRGRPRDSRPPGRCWRSSRRSCRGCAPADRRCPSASAASAGIAFFTSVGGGDLRRACVIAPMTSAPPSVALMPSARRCRRGRPGRSAAPGAASASGSASCRRRASLPSLAGARAFGGVGDAARAVIVESRTCAFSPFRPGPCLAACTARQTFCGRGRHLDVARSPQRVDDGVDHAPAATRSRPTSPQPFTPSGLCVQGVVVRADLEGSAGRRRAACCSPCRSRSGAGPLLVVDAVLEQRLADALGDAAVHLALDDHRVDDACRSRRPRRSRRCRSRRCRDRSRPRRCASRAGKVKFCGS